MIQLLAAVTASLASFHPAPANVVVQGQQTAPERHDLGDGLYMIVGAGGNIMVSIGEDGGFVVDTQFANIAQANLDLIAEVSDKPVEFVLNTHFHGDHTGGNAAFHAEGATIIAHDNVRKRLNAASEGSTTSSLPVITFSENTTFHWNAQEIRIMHTPQAHTDGDTIVFLPKANVLHTGDVMFKGRYPFIDLAGGGTVQGAIDALTHIYNLANDETEIVPGHGPLANRADVMAIVDMLNAGRTAVRQEMMQGKSREDVISSTPLAAFDEDWTWRFITSDRMTGTFYDDLLATDAEARAAVENN